MKKLLLLFIATLTLTSCDTDDDYSGYTYEYLTTENATVPEDMEVGESYKIYITYIQPTSCYTFDSLYYYKTTEVLEDEEGEELPFTTEVRTIAVVNRIIESSETECEDLNEETEISFTFIPEEAGPYLFKFWAGTDENGEDVFLEFERDIVNVL
ncbi:hypothetical protein FNB79_03640 [Formosa sediminum]|uniref:Uncharacterized protein n=1 Tax=Formosa sediminum TaxID=2594004 RepID=A0A516GNM1_9FLAO|nr:hypothetical protein [Formosa sediminum]QDO93105.1 hypothetical protein FNB79_03640 [Formosa sediminum]